jgi:VIT1/CCC1 family predicted Fe2+/Mn2+ transporter
MRALRRSISVKADLLVRNIIFGVEDSLVSTLGLLSGIATAGVSRSVILLTGVILIAVEAVSMGVGSLLTEHSIEEFREGRDMPMRRAVIGGAIMLVSYLIAGFIPLAPYMLLPVNTAFPVSIAAALAALFGLGAIAALFFKTRAIRHGMEMLLLGGLAMGIGVAVGRLVDHVG